MKTSAKNFFTKEEKERIIEAVKLAEKDTSGEIRVHLENTTHKKEVMDRAAYIFKYLRMYETKDRNGVLFYFAIKDKQFAILGDKGIDDNVPSDFWETMKNDLQVSFAKGEFVEALIKAIRQAGKRLMEAFPYASDDVNELPDEISFED